MATAAAALVSVLSSTASAAAAGARGDEAAAARAAGQAAAAALQAVRDAGLLQPHAGQGGAAAAGAQGPREAAAGQRGAAAAAAGQGLAEAAAAGQGGEAAAAGQGGEAATAGQGGEAAAAAGQGPTEAATAGQDRQAEAVAFEEAPGGAAAEDGGLSEPEPVDWQAVARDMAGTAADLASPATASPVVPAGGGALLLLPPGKRWEGKGWALEGTFTHGGQQYRRYCIVQLQKPLLINSSEPQQASFRIAAECCGQQEPLIGSWSKQAYSLSVTPQVTLLLPTQPRHAVKRRLRAGQDAAKSHVLLYGNAFSQAAIDFALGESFPVSNAGHLHKGLV